jgi:hypothetical protein
MSLLQALMDAQELSKMEALEVINEMKERIVDGENPEEILFEEGLEPDYVFDLI